MLSHHFLGSKVLASSFTGCRPSYWRFGFHIVFQVVNTIFPASILVFPSQPAQLFSVFFQCCSALFVTQILFRSYCSFLSCSLSRYLYFVPKNSYLFSTFTATMDTQSLEISQHRLTGVNFREWSQLVLLIIRGEGKVGFWTTRSWSRERFCHLLLLGSWELHCHGEAEKLMEPKIGRNAKDIYRR